jgi:predicted site-specific integrase-resolvase
VTPLCVSIKEAAKAIGISESVLRRYIADGLLATTRFPSTEYDKRPGRRILIAVSDLEEFVRKHREVA